MCRWMPLLLVLAAACALRAALPALPFGLGSRPATEMTSGQAVHVYAPPGVEAVGSDVPLLYLEEGRALFLPEGADDAAHAVVPDPSELVELMRREDIVIIAVDPEVSTPPATGWMGHLARVATSVLRR